MLIKWLKNVRNIKDGSLLQTEIYLFYHFIYKI